MKNGTVLLVGAFEADGLLRQALRKHGYELARAAVARAHDAWEGRPLPACVLLGPELGRQDAALLCRRVKLSTRLNRLRVLALAASRTRRPPRRSILVEPDAYLDAFLSPAALARAVDAACRRARADGPERPRFAVSVVMGSSLSLLGQVTRMLEELLAHTGLSPRERLRVTYAALEMVVNAIEWGNRWNPDKTVRLVFSVFEDRLCLRIEDEGEGFDVHEMRRAAKRDEDGERRFRGYGVRVCREFVDEVSYNEPGNSVTLVKYLRTAEPQRSGIERPLERP